MLRDVSMDEISDGRLYGLNDMVKADCRDCVGCSECCHGMGESIELDPLDVWRLARFLKVQPERLFDGALALHASDGVALPHLALTGRGEACRFLDEKGRCSVHAARPGICRMFPLGRYYHEDGSFSYFMQLHECVNTNRAKVKVKKWIDMTRPVQYDAYITRWHRFLTELRERGAVREASALVLKECYLRPFAAADEDTFYRELDLRIEDCRARL